MTAQPPLLIDGLNLAYWCGPPPSLRLPLTALAALLAQGHRAQIVFDASSRHRLAAERELYEALDAWPQYFVEVPAGRTADAVLLRQARREAGRIVTRDRYGDHRRRFRKLIDEPGRLIDGYATDGTLHLPVLGIVTGLPPTPEAAWSTLRRALEAAPQCREQPTS